MTDVILVGACGRMGKKVAEAISRDENFNLAFSVDPAIGKTLSDCNVEAEQSCIIDFSTHETALDIAKFIKKTGTPAVIATTGHSDEEVVAIKEASQFAPIFFAGNMSVGVGLTCKLASEVATTFKDADCEIVETHHNKKKDAPSGTALMIANAIIEARGFGTVVAGRSGFGERQAGEVGISAVRRGNVVGVHSVIFDTGTQSIEIKHTSADRALFADGALFAASFLANKENGLYTMEDLLCE